MSRALLTTLARRAAVLVATGAVLGVAIASIGLAAEWRAAEAPLDVAPVSLSSIDEASAIELERAADLEAQVAGVAGQVSDLQAALLAAGASVDADAAGAAELREQLDSAKDKLQRMQKQLKAAQQRLAELNAAAARQASSTRQASSGGGGDRHEDEHEDEHEEDDDD